MKRISRLASVFLAGMALNACSSGHAGRADDAKRLATLKGIGACAVDRDYVYVLSGNSVSRVDRRTGAVTFLTNDVAGLGLNLVIERGAVFWNDGEGIEVFDPGAAGRKNLARSGLSAFVAFTRFGDEACWANLDAPPKVQCISLASRTVTYTAQVAKAVQRLASNGRRLYAIENLASDASGKLRVALEELLPNGEKAGLAEMGAEDADGLSATDDSPVWLGRSGLWRLANGKPMRIGSLQSLGEVVAMSGHIYAATDSAVVDVDPLSGATSNIVATHGFGDICADDHSLYVEDASTGDLFEIPIDHR